MNQRRTGGRLVVDALPEEREPRLALMLYYHAWRSARTGRDGAYVPLTEQDPARWSLALIGEAELALATAARQLHPAASRAVRDAIGPADSAPTS